MNWILTLAMCGLVIITVAFVMFAIDLFIDERRFKWPVVILMISGYAAFQSGLIAWLIVGILS